MTQSKRQNLQRLIRLFVIIALLFSGYVLIGFTTTDTATDSARNYRIELPELALQQAYFFKAGHRQIVIVRHARQGKAEDYFVAYAIGTNLGCPLQVTAGNTLKESCSSAEYDLRGQPVEAGRGFTALHVPVYNFCQDFSCLNLRM